MGAKARARARARERRRRVFVFLLEAAGLSFLIGLVPPLRGMWLATAMLLGLLVLYTWVLIRLKQVDREVDRTREQFVAAIEAPGPAVARQGNGHGLYERHVADRGSRTARPSFNGLRIIEEDDAVHVVVHANGNGNGHRNGNGNGNGHRNGNGNGNGHRRRTAVVR